MDVDCAEALTPWGLLHDQVTGDFAAGSVLHPPYLNFGGREHPRASGIMWLFLPEVGV
jgi:hypothetical protein